jgi:hypothetical protein
MVLSEINTEEVVVWGKSFSEQTQVWDGSTISPAVTTPPPSTTKSINKYRKRVARWKLPKTDTSYGGSTITTSAGTSADQQEPCPGKRPRGAAPSFLLLSLPLHVTQLPEWKLSITALSFSPWSPLPIRRPSERSRLLEGSSYKQP